MGPQPPGIPCRPEGAGDSRVLGKSTECSRQEHSVVHWRRSRPGTLHQDQAYIRGAGDFSAENYAGRNFHFGSREHAMGAIVNGMSLVKVRPFGSGFFTFVDY